MLNLVYLALELNDLLFEALNIGSLLRTSVLLLKQLDVVVVEFYISLLQFLHVSLLLLVLLLRSY